MEIKNNTEVAIEILSTNINALKTSGVAKDLMVASILYNLRDCICFNEVDDSFIKGLNSFAFHSDDYIKNRLSPIVKQTQSILSQ